MAKRNRITSAMSQTIAESSPLIKSLPKLMKTVGTENIHNIPLSALVKNPFQPRIDMDTNALNDLISSIEENGLLQPIVVTKKTDATDKYIIIAGHRRFEAHKIMGKETIKATVLQNIQNKELAILSLTENMIRENLHPIENAISIKNILDQGVVESQNKLAEYLGLSKGHISKMISILKLPTSLLQRIKEVNYRDINVLSLLNKIENLNNMLKTFEEIKSMTRLDAEKYIKNILSPESIINKELYKSKISKTKINVEITIKDLNPTVIEAIKMKLQELSSLINSTERF